MKFLFYENPSSICILWDVVQIFFLFVISFGLYSKNLAD